MSLGWVRLGERRVRIVIWVMLGWERAEERAAEPMRPVAPVRMRCIFLGLGSIVLWAFVWLLSGWMLCCSVLGLAIETAQV